MSTLWVKEPQTPKKEKEKEKLTRQYYTKGIKQ